MARGKPRQLDLTSRSLEEAEAEAIAFLQEHEPPDQEGYFVGFSGGKDSIVTLDLVKKSGVKYKAFHSFTGIDAPEVIRFILKNYPDVEILHPKESVYKLIPKKAPPSRIARWCCDKLKKEPAWNLPYKYRVMGIRAEESWQRAKRPRVDDFKGHHFILKPIFDWKEYEVWDYIEKYKLAYPSLYDEGNARIGCIVCPFQFGTGEKAKARIKASQERYPLVWKAYKNACHKWYDSKNQHFYWHKSFAQWFEDWLGGYAKTREMNKNLTKPNEEFNG